MANLQLNTDNSPPLKGGSSVRGEDFEKDHRWNTSNTPQIEMGHPRNASNAPKYNKSIFYNL